MSFKTISTWLVVLFLLSLAGCAARENCAYYEPVPHGHVIYYHCRDVSPSRIPK